MALCSWVFVGAVFCGLSVSGSKQASPALPPSPDVGAALRNELNRYRLMRGRVSEWDQPPAPNEETGDGINRHGRLRPAMQRTKHTTPHAKKKDAHARAHTHTHKTKRPISRVFSRVRVLSYEHLSCVHLCVFSNAASFHSPCQASQAIGHLKYVSTNSERRTTRTTPRLQIRGCAGKFQDKDLTTAKAVGPPIDSGT